MWSHWRRFGSNSGAIDADLDQNVEPLTPIRITFWSHWRDMDQNSEPLTPSRFGLARKFKPGGLFKWGKKTQMNFLMILLYWGGPWCRHSFINQIEETSLRALWIWQHKYCQCPQACPAYFAIVLASLYWDILAGCLKMTANHAVILKKHARMSLSKVSRHCVSKAFIYKNMYLVIGSL